MRPVPTVRVHGIDKDTRETYRFLRQKGRWPRHESRIAIAGLSLGVHKCKVILFPVSA